MIANIWSPVPVETKEAEIQRGGKASEQGYASIQLYHRFLHIGDNGIPTGDLHAYMWLNIAKANRNKFAQE